MQDDVGYCQCNSCKLASKPVPNDLRHKIAAHNLCVAVFANDIALVQRMLQNGVLARDCVDTWGRTPTTVCFEQPGVEMLQLLLNYGASITQKDNEGGEFF